MVNISNELSRSCPISESTLKLETQDAFKNCSSNIDKGIETLLKKLTGKSEAQGYKFIVTVTLIGESSQGPIKTCTGAYWNAEQDGTWVNHLEELRLLVSITWVHT